MSAVSGAQTDAERLIERFIEGKREDLENPHRDADVLIHHYWDEGQTADDVADELGVSQGTISNWLEKTGLGARPRSRVERADFRHDSDGYEVWRVCDPEGETFVGVHQLLAVADGADPAEVWAEDTHVHHCTGLQWLNLPDMVEVVGPDEHVRTHVAGEWTTEDGIPVLETQE